MKQLKAVSEKVFRTAAPKWQSAYLTEAGLRIQHEGFTVCEEKNALLPVEWAGSPIYNVNGNGGMSYDPEQIRKEGLDDALERVREIVEDTLTYMRHMETAPPLLADGLSGDYRLQDGTLWQGHYFNAGEGIDAAKRDFTARSGLVPAALLFTREQLSVIFDAAQNMTTLNLVSNPEQGRLLEGIMKQIEEAVPQVIDLANELTESPRQPAPGEMQLY